MKGLFPERLGVRLVEAGAERVVGEIDVEAGHCTTPGIAHGGALMALADTLGAYATAIQLPPGARTTTIESKTNFMAAVRAGTTLRGECVPLHRGRRTMVWQTTLRNAEGAVAAVVTQTQIVLPREPGPEEPRQPSPEHQLAALFRDRTPEEMRATLARLERGGAAIYEMLAKAEPDEAAREALLAAGRRELENAAALEAIEAQTSATSKR